MFEKPIKIEIEFRYLLIFSLASSLLIQAVFSDDGFTEAAGFRLNTTVSTNLIKELIACEE